MAQRRRGAELPLLLLTHGRDQAQTDPAVMKVAWTKALRTTLEKADFEAAATIPIDLAFYGDLWKPVAERGARRLVKASVLQKDVAQDLLGKTGERGERGGWQTLGQVIDTLDAHFHVGDLVIEMFLRDLDDYFDKENLRKAADARIAAMARGHRGRVILLGHSMGSIVGYHLLATAPDSVGGLDGLLTFGSPLGLPSIHRRMSRLVPATPWPGVVNRWDNIWNVKDFATVHHDLSSLFLARGGQQKIVDIQAHAGEPTVSDLGRGHDPLDYIGSSELAEAVVALIGGDARGAREGKRTPRRVVRGAHPMPIERIEIREGGGGGQIRRGEHRFRDIVEDLGGVGGVGGGGGAGHERGLRMRADFEPVEEPGWARAKPPIPSPPSRIGQRPKARAMRAAARPAREPAGGVAARPPAGNVAPAPRTIQPTASADFPQTVAPGSQRRLVVAVGPKAIYDAAVAVLDKVQVPAGVESIALRVALFAPAFEVRTTATGRLDNSAVLDLRVDGQDGQSVEFFLTGRQTRRRVDTKIEVTFFQGSTPAGALTVRTAVDPDFVEDPPAARLTLHRTEAAPDPDLTFVITDRSDGLIGAGPFDIRVSREGQYFERSLGQFRVTVNVVSEAQRWLERFHDVVNWNERDWSGRIHQIGSALWWLMPADFQRFYWKEMHGKKLTIAIYSQEPYIPWELIVPQKTYDSRREQMLGMAFPIARWTQGLAFPTPAPQVQLSVIAPDYSDGDELPEAQKEAKLLMARYGAIAGPVRRQAVRRLLRRGEGVVHFAGHGSYDPELVELSAIELLDGSLNPGDLPRPLADGSTTRPFIFLNACEVGEQGFDLTALGGWASEFCKRGFAGFVGPYWAVKDEIAGKAAATFYDELSNGKTVAQAVQAIRLRFLADPHPSWLAYTVHCQPNVTLAVKANQGGPDGR